MHSSYTADRGLFERPVHSFEVDQRALRWISDDEANPLNRIAQIIPEGARVLDVGAGNGVLARLLEYQKRECVIDGVEPDSVAQRAAQSNYRHLFCGTVDEFIGARGNHDIEQYDVIVMADVMEHIANPVPILEQLKELLTPDGKLVISTPNVAFASVRLALMFGQFEYVDSGILERTHLRFYTLRSLERLFKAVRLYPHAQYYCLRDPRHTEIHVESFPLASVFLSFFRRDELARVYQFLFVLGVGRPDHLIRMDLGIKHGQKKSLVQRVFGRVRGVFVPRGVAR